MIELKNVSFHYSAQGEQDIPSALHEINLRIHEGEFLAIIGHNGSGKSTLARLIAGMLQPQHGSVLVDSLNGARGGQDLWAIRERVGMVFQNPDDQLIANTVLDEIAFGPENLMWPRQEINERVQEVIDLLDLKPYTHTTITELSPGIKQRVAIAGVLVMRPRYVILDEPTSMISGQTARRLLHTLQDLAHTRQIAVIYITHFMQEISSFERVVVMDKGQVLMDDRPAAVFSRINELQAVGLDIPVVTRLGWRLAAQGWPHVPEVVLTSEQLLSEALPLPPDTGRALAVQEIAPLSMQQPETGAAEVSGLPQIRAEDQPLFVLKNLGYTYQRETSFARPALQDLTLTLPAGRVSAVVGASGSGKSTLVDILAGLTRPHTGSFLFAGLDASAASFKLERIRARVGVVFQSPEQQIFEETVGKDVSFGPRQKKVALAESRRLVQESLEAVGLPYEDFRSRYTYALSGGQKRRVAIAGVLALQPEVIIFDEPMAGLDPRGCAELFNLLLSLKQRGNLTIIYASSSLKDVIELADDIYVLERGRLAFSGTPREILAQADVLHQLDIILPEAAQIARTLRRVLSTLRTDVINGEELEAAILQARSGESLLSEKTGPFFSCQ